MMKRSVRNARYTNKIEPRVQLWMLRILINLGAHREFTKHGLSSDAIAEVIGLGEWLDPARKDFDAKLITAELRKLHRLAENKITKTPLPICLQQNIGQLSNLVGMTSTDCRILEFAVSIHSERLLDDAADLLGNISSAKTFHALSIILDLPESDIRSSLSAQGILARSGLVSVDRSGMSSLRVKLNLLSETFADLMITSESDPVSLLRGTVTAAAPGELKLTDYDHIQTSLDILQPYLRQTMATGRRGVNIFLHGSPGTGKSQLARALAADLGCELFEVASEDTDGDPVSGQKRLRAFQAAQSFFAQRPALIVFDEVEDVFDDGDGFSSRKSTAQVRKAWINRTLEENPVPALWLSNSISCLDPAFVRRFDMVFELPVPPKRQRERILKDCCGDFIDADRISRIADSETLAPAVVAKASSVVRSIQNVLGAKKACSAFEQLMRYQSCLITSCSGSVWIFL